MRASVERLRERLWEQMRSFQPNIAQLQRLRKMAENGELHAMGFRWLQFRPPGTSHSDWELLPVKPLISLSDSTPKNLFDAFDRLCHAGCATSYALWVVVQSLESNFASRHDLLYATINYASQTDPNSVGSADKLIETAETDNWPKWAVLAVPTLVARRSDGVTLVWKPAARIVLGTPRQAGKSLCRGQVLQVDASTIDSESLRELRLVDQWRHDPDISSVQRFVKRAFSDVWPRERMSQLLGLACGIETKLDVTYDRLLPLLERHSSRLKIRARSDSKERALSVEVPRGAIPLVEHYALGDDDLHPDPMITSANLAQLMASEASS